MSNKSIVDEIREAHLAMELISLGARMQVLESETSLSRRRLLRMYKELKGCSPPRGLLPFSPDWFMAWEHNVHSSMFYNIYLYLQKIQKDYAIENMLKAYKLYLEQCPCDSSERPVLGLTRAWTLIRFIKCNMITHTKCCCCGGSFIVTTEQSNKQFTCSLCSTPSRAIKRSYIDEVSMSPVNTFSEAC